MIRFPGKLTVEQFLGTCWQKKPLLMPAALVTVRPQLSRNELGWLATLEDVESRLVFRKQENGRVRYTAESGPFDPEYLAALPRRDWTLLVHDVEKHLPAFRAWFREIPFVPDWRIDDLMVSFAAPGGGVGPHRDNYDVFLCQGIGVRDWRFTEKRLATDRMASSDLDLLEAFEGDERHDLRAGDVLYLPPGIAHWGTAKRACITYSIGMRAPRLSDLVDLTNAVDDPFYSDVDLQASESVAGHISRRALQRTRTLTGSNTPDDLADRLGCLVTQPKSWLAPDDIVDAENVPAGRILRLHGMSQIAWDDSRLYVNGDSRSLPPQQHSVVTALCGERALSVQQQKSLSRTETGVSLLRWLARQGAFDFPEVS